MGKEGLPRQGEDKRVSQLEDRVLKTAAQFFGEDLLPYVGVKGMIDRLTGWRPQNISIWRCAGWRKTLTLS